MKGLLKTLIGKLTGSSKKSTLHTHSTWISQEIEFKVLDEKNSKKIASGYTTSGDMNYKNSEHSASHDTTHNAISDNPSFNSNSSSNSNNHSDNINSASSQPLSSQNDEDYQSANVANKDNHELPLSRQKQLFTLDSLDDLANQLTHQIFMIKQRHSTYFNFELLLNQWDMNMSFLSHLNQELIKHETTFDTLIAEPNGFLKTKTIVEKLILSLYNQHYPAAIKSV
jgi:hypothetical protein